MKLIVSLVTLSALFQDVALGFSFQQNIRPSSPSALKMSVEEAETKEIVKVGVIGCGRIGLVHLEAIGKAPGVTPVIVSNPTVSKAEKGKKRESLRQGIQNEAITKHRSPTVDMGSVFSSATVIGTIVATF